MPAISANNPLIRCLALSQLLAWGCLYHSISIFASGISQSTGWSNTMVFMGFTCAVGTAGLVGPLATHLAFKYGARKIMVGGNLIGAAGLLGIASTSFFPAYLFFWVVVGTAMAASLYDVAFIGASEAIDDPIILRKAVSLIAIVGGFASSVAWPLLSFVGSNSSWRTALSLCAGALVFNAIIVSRMPNFRSKIPHRFIAPKMHGDQAPATSIFYVAIGLSLMALISSGITLLLPRLATILKTEPASGLWVLSLFGPMQVLGRLAETAFLAKYSAFVLLLLSTVVMGASGFILMMPCPAIVNLFCFVLVFGVSNGLITVVRSVFVMEYFGRPERGYQIGFITGLSFFMRAIGPILFTLFIETDSLLHVPILSILCTSIISLGFLLMASPRTSPGTEA